MRVLPVVIMVLVALVFGPVAMAQTAVRLRASAQLVAGAAVRLADIATITGPDAERLGASVVVPIGTGRGEVTLSDVRGALGGAGVNWGQVTLSGRGCVLQAPAAPARPLAPAPKETRGARPEVVDCSQPATVRTMIAQRIAANLKITPEQLRLKFMPAGETDGGLLDRAIAPGERTEVQAGATVGAGGVGAAGRMPVRVTVLNNDQVLASGTINVDALVERPCVSLSEAVDRDRVLTADVLLVQTQWVVPSAPAPLTLEDVLNRPTSRRRRAGEVLDRSDVQSPLLVRKGDEVTVQCFTGSISIETRAFALADGRLDETISLALDKTKDRKPFTARVSARGRAVRIDSGAAAAAPSLPEPPARSATKRTTRQ
ncbi:MAG: flagellar basal body P-ring formation chaperone FlgA [Phycisphaerales bacterium]